MKRETLVKIFKFLFRRLTKLTYEGLENIPAEGGVIIATNHLSRLDFPAMFIVADRADITALVADKYQGYFLFNFIIRTAGGIYLDRSKADFSAFGSGVDFLRKGGALGIAPEGTRSKVGSLLEGKAGTVLLATRAKVPVVPVAITGTETAVKKLLRFQRPQIHVRVGPAFTLPPLDRDQRHDLLKQYTDEVMCRIAAMMPDKYHGFYNDNPRIREIQADLTSRPADKIIPL